MKRTKTGWVKFAIPFNTHDDLWNSYLPNYNRKSFTFQLFVHNKDYEAFYKHVPKEILPKEYGGDGGTTKEMLGEWMILQF